jgi:uncharacterized repeat protein (TIGR03803 family)
MKIRGLLLAVGTIPIFSAGVWAATVSCPIQITADKTNVCVGEQVSITVVKTVCATPVTTNFFRTYYTNGVYTVSNQCTACDSAVSWAYLNIYVSAPTNLSPAAVTMCKGSYMTFTELGNPGTFSCDPAWTIYPTNAGTLSANGQSAMFTLSASCTNASVTLYASCGTTTNSATITVSTNTSEISSQPTSQVVCTGATVNLSVALTGGLGSSSYQWQRDGINLTDSGHISGTTSSTLTISNLSSADTSCDNVPALLEDGNFFGTVVAGVTYTYTATGTASYECGYYVNPDGLPSGGTTAASYFSCPGLKTLSLVGKINGGTCIQLGSSGTFVASSSGELRLLMNDSVGGFYNNCGAWNVCISSPTIQYDVVVTSDCGSLISTTATLFVSTPCDGIPDWWRLQYFGTTNINTNTCASCDPANDCLSNLEKYQLGLNPTNHAPIATLTGSETICNGGSTTIQAVLAGNGPWMVSWSDGVITTNSSSPATHTVSPTSTTNYTITAVSNGSCSGGTGTGSITITVNTNIPPSCSITGPTSVCTLSSSNSYSAVADMGSYNWTISGNATITGASTQQTVWVTAGVSNSFQLVVEISTTNGCSASCTNIIAINPLPPVIIDNAPTAVCSDSDGNLASITSQKTTLYSFTGGDDGSTPYAPLVLANDGKLYGTTSGGIYGAGTVFSITSDGTSTTLYHFGSGTDGVNPYSGVIIGNDGNLYGTTVGGGTHGMGTVFRLSPTGGVAFVTLHNFGDSTNEGAQPYAGLVLANDGNFYGVTSSGGSNNVGTVFRITSSGTLTTLYSFSGEGEEVTPYGGLVQGTDGKFYGTTAGNFWTGIEGEVFAITSEGVLTNLHSFTGAWSEDGNQGYQPQAALVQGRDGNLYGTTVEYDYDYYVFGTVFAISPSGVFTNLYSFSGGTDGGDPQGALIQGADGNFYGTTAGLGSAGTIFQITPQGTLSTMYGFGGGSDGGAPFAGLVRGADGYFYGTTAIGGEGDNGTIYKILPDTYSWTIDNGAITAGQSNSLTTWTAGTNGTVILGLTATSIDGCVNTATRTVTVNETPTCSIGGPDTVCAGATNTFVGPDEAGLSYSWSISGSGTITGVNNAQTVEISGTSSGGFTLSLTVTSTAGCSSSCSDTVAVNDVPFSTIQGPSTVCPSDGTYGYRYMGSLGIGFTYQWTITGNGVITGPTDQRWVFVYADGPTGGPITLGLTVSADSCPSATTNFVITVNNVGPEAPIVGNNSPLCLGETLSLSASASPGVDYIWTGPNGFESALQNPTIPGVTTNNSGFYCVTAVQGICASTQSCVQVVVIPSPSATVTGTTNIFVGGLATIQAELTGTPNWILTWSDGVITTNPSSPAIRSVTPESTTTYFVTTMSDANCSIGTISGGATVAPSDSLIEGPRSVCPLSVSNSYTAVLGMASYSWFVAGRGTITGATNQRTVYTSADASGTFTMTVSLTDTNGVNTNCTTVVAIDPDMPPILLFNGSAGGGFETCATSVNNTMSTPGPYLLTTIYNFTGAEGNISSGGLIQGNDGNFYGTTGNGGAYGGGTLFELTSAGTLTTLHSFGVFWNDGADPNGAPVQGSDGALYGTTSWGGSNGHGVVYKLSSAGTYTVLHEFSWFGTEGSEPYSGLIQASDGDFYGTTYSGGTNGNGVVYKISSVGTLTTVYAFQGSEGANPFGSLAQGTDSNFYGTANYGGTNGNGTVFKVTSEGTLTALYSFTGGADGGAPRAGLTLGNDGNFYGMTYDGWPPKVGTIFKISSAGILTTLYTFTSTDGNQPVNLAQGNDGYFYGTITGGSVFKISSAGTLTTVYSFTGGADGYALNSNLILGRDGEFYGMTGAGGATGNGTVFKIDSIPGVYSWSITNGTITSGQNTWNTTWTAGTNSTATLCLTVTNPLGCVVVTCTDVILDPAPSAIITAPPFVVIGSTNNVASVADAGSDALYNWSLQNGVVLEGDGSNTITWLAEADPVTLTVSVWSDASDCPGISSIAVPVNGIPTPTASSDGPICEGHTLHLFATTIAGASYNWSGPNDFSSSLQNPLLDDAVFADSGQYCVTATINGSSSDPTCITVAVNSLPDATIIATGAACASSTNNRASVPNAGTGAAYSWAITNGTINAGAGTSNIIWAAGPTGTVTLTVTVSSGTSCSNNGSMDVTIDSPPAVTITVPPSVCASSTNNTASVSDAGAGTSYSWSISNGSITSSNNAPSIVWLAGTAGTATVSVIMNTAAGCNISNSANVAVASLPACSIVGPDTVTSNSAGNVYSETNGAGLAYNWTITGAGTITGSSWDQWVDVEVANSGSFTLALTVTNVGGCVAICAKTVTVSGGPTPLTPDAGWWRFNEGMGTNAYDSSVNGNIGYLEGVSLPNWTSGISSNALLFDGTNNQVRIPDNIALTPTDVVSVAAWIMTSPTTNGVIISKWASDGSDGSYHLALWHGLVIFQLSAGGTSFSVTGATVVADANWHHVAGVYDGAQLRVYIDGTMDGVAMATGPIDVVSAPLLIGHATGGLGFPGRITDVRIYSRVLAESEVADIFNTDTDGDGIPDWWMQKYFGHSTGLASDNTLAISYYGTSLVDNLTAYLEGLDPTKGPAIPDAGGIVNLEVFTPLE